MLENVQLVLDIHYVHYTAEIKRVTYIQSEDSVKS